MKKQTNIILPIVLVVVAALGFAGWRMWGHTGALTGAWPELEGGVYATAISHDGFEYLVPETEIYDTGLQSEDRPALTDPKMVDITTADTKLADELEGIAVTVGNQQRFYPFQILNWHEVLNVEVGDKSLVITYSPLTGSAVVYEDDRHFSDAGRVYNNAMLMQADGEDTLWNQTTGQAIMGKDEVGQKLTVYPSTVMSWATWKDLHPDGLALSTDTGFARDYGRHPYASYETSSGIFFPLNYTFNKIEPKDLVYRVDGVDYTDAPVMFTARYLPAQTDPNMDIETANGKVLIVAFYDEDTDVVRVFRREVDGQTLTFENVGGRITDLETGSVWSADGQAMSGDYRGTGLTEVSVTRHYAFAQLAMFPKTVMSGAELLPADDVVTDGEELIIQ